MARRRKHKLLKKIKHIQHKLFKKKKSYKKKKIFKKSSFPGLLALSSEQREEFYNKHFLQKKKIHKRIIHKKHKKSSFNLANAVGLAGVGLVGAGLILNPYKTVQGFSVQGMGIPSSVNPNPPMPTPAPQPSPNPPSPTPAPQPSAPIIGVSYYVYNGKTYTYQGLFWTAPDGSILPFNPISWQNSSSGLAAPISPTLFVPSSPSISVKQVFGALSSNYPGYYLNVTGSGLLPNASVNYLVYFGNQLVSLSSTNTDNNGNLNLWINESGLAPIPANPGQWSVRIQITAAGYDQTIGAS